MEFNPHKLSEATLQAEFYHQCRLVGLECFLEYKSKWNGKLGSRFDCVIVKDKKITAIIEVKSRRNLDKAKVWRNNKWPVSAKYKKYSQFGVPLYVLLCIEEIPVLIEKLKGGI